MRKINVSKDSLRNVAGREQRESKWGSWRRFGDFVGRQIPRGTSSGSRKTQATKNGCIQNYFMFWSSGWEVEVAHRADGNLHGQCFLGRPWIRLKATLTTPCSKTVKQCWDLMFWSPRTARSSTPSLQKANRIALRKCFLSNSMNDRWNANTPVPSSWKEIVCLFNRMHTEWHPGFVSARQIVAKYNLPDHLFKCVTSLPYFSDPLFVCLFSHIPSKNKKERKKWSLKSTFSTVHLRICFAQ